MIFGDALQLLQIHSFTVNINSFQSFKPASLALLVVTCLEAGGSNKDETFK